MQTFNRYRHPLAALVLFIAVGLIYRVTLAPGLTWANQGVDGGDLITAAITTGVAHPSGYPTWLAIARLFQQLPLGDPLALRTNLLSALCGALAAVVVADLIYYSYPGSWRAARLAGLLAGFAFGLSPLLWSQAVITEVYALHTLLVALVVWLMPLGRQQTQWMVQSGGLLLGLALGNHLTAVLLLPPWLLVGVLHTRPRWRIDWRALLPRVLWTVPGLLIYFTLPLRASSGSPVNWGNPANWEGVWWLLSGQAYQERLFTLPTDYILPRLQGWAGLLLHQFGWLGLIVGLYGLYEARTTGPRVRAITLWMAAAFTLFSIGYSSFDSYAYLIPVYMAFAIWLGLGIATLLEALARYDARALLPASLLALLLVVFHTVRVLPTVDASQDTRAEDFGQAVMAEAPDHALILVGEDEETFTLWYFHFALRQRRDLAVVNTSLLGYDWYRQSIDGIYPGLVHPDSSDQMPTLASGTRPVCWATPDGPEPLDCPAP